jgi:sec-independent protein translocase protein TatC
MCFIFGMIFTPPDIVSQFLMAIPMYILFEIGLIFSYEKKSKSIS